MNIKKLSINKACIAFSIIFLLAASIAITVLYLLTQNIAAVLCMILFCIFSSSCLIFFIFLVRRKIILFSDTLCTLLDHMLAGKIEPAQAAEEESIFYKINCRLRRLYEIMFENRNSIAKERSELQELISDISHQVKTPIANLKMINQTLLEQEIPSEKQLDFFNAQAGQLDKLDFLIQAMIKTSRLETGVISLKKKYQSVYDTLAIALGGVILNAEKKQIDIRINCPERLMVSHDQKWTSEAFFNILDNAVKYTPDSGKIFVHTECWELYLKIDFHDTGIGIPEHHQGTIFKRFYRENDVHDVEGIGIGLYLAREIITLQGGYIKVVSTPGKGSIFSVFLPME